MNREDNSYVKVRWFRWGTWHPHDSTAVLFTLTEWLPLAGNSGFRSWLSRRGHSQLSWERLPEGLFGQKGRSSSQPGRHFSAASVISQESDVTMYVGDIRDMKTTFRETVVAIIFWNYRRELWLITWRCQYLSLSRLFSDHQDHVFFVSICDGQIQKKSHFVSDAALVRLCEPSGKL